VRKSRSSCEEAGFAGALGCWATLEEIRAQESAMREVALRAIVEGMFSPRVLVLGKIETTQFEGKW
jgi:hypothetical protein